MTLKPLWPLASYIINYDYIANVLCENKDVPEMKCNGKCYLSKMLARESEQNKENPFETSILKVDHTPLQVTVPGTYHFSGNQFKLANTRPHNQPKQLLELLFVFEKLEPPKYALPLCKA